MQILRWLWRILLNGQCTRLLILHCVTRHGKCMMQIPEFICMYNEIGWIVIRWMLDSTSYSIITLIVHSINYNGHWYNFQFYDWLEFYPHTFTLVRAILVFIWIIFNPFPFVIPFYAQLCPCTIFHDNYINDST